MRFDVEQICLGLKIKLERCIATPWGPNGLRNMWKKILNGIENEDSCEKSQARY